MLLAIDQVPVLIAAGAAALGLMAFLWALRVSDGARGAARKFRDRSMDLEAELAEKKSLLGAHPGAILVWDADTLDIDSDEITPPQLYGSPSGLAGLLSLTDDSVSHDAAVRIIEGLADLEARDVSGQDTTLRLRLRELREGGQPFSLTIIGPGGRFLEADGRTAGARAVVWVSDATIKGYEESSARGRLEEARLVIARDPAAFLEMLRKSPFPAWRVSGVGKLQWANPAYVSAVDGGSFERVIERQLMLDQESIDQARRTIAEGREIDETRHLGLNAERRAMRILTFPLSGGAGGMAFDVTEQEAAREELKRHVQGHDETLNHVADGVAIFGADRSLMFYNKAFRDMWDLDEAYLLDRPKHGQVLDRLRDQRKLPARADFPKWRAEELAYYLDMQGMTEDTWTLPDGRKLKVTRQRHPMGGLLLIFKDITIELDLQARFNQMIKTQASTLDRLHEGVAVFSSKGKLLLSNQALETLWNLTPEDTQNQPDFGDFVKACMPLFDDRNVWSNIEAHTTDVAPEMRVMTVGRMVRKDDTTLDYVTQPLPDTNTLIAFADMTAQRNIEAALKDRADMMEQAERLRQEVVRHVSYQLRTPLTSISGYAQMLDSHLHGQLNPMQTNSVECILSASKDLESLIDNIIDLTLIDAGDMELNLETVDVMDLVTRSVRLIASDAKERRITVRTEASGEIGTIVADPKRLQQVLFNLLNNATRFVGEGGEVVTSVQRAGALVRISVRDNGCGMPVEKRAESFERFVSSDQRAGLGLSLVNQLVHLHGGKVGMAETEGGGLDVTCWFPLVAAIPQDARPDASGRTVDAGRPAPKLAVAS